MAFEWLSQAQASEHLGLKAHPFTTPAPLPFALALGTRPPPTPCLLALPAPSTTLSTGCSSLCEHAQGLCSKILPQARCVLMDVTWICRRTVFSYKMACYNRMNLEGIVLMAKNTGVCLAEKPKIGQGRIFLGRKKSHGDMPVPKQRPEPREGASLQSLAKDSIYSTSETELQDPKGHVLPITVLLPCPEHLTFLHLCVTHSFQSPGEMTASRQTPPRCLQTLSLNSSTCSAGLCRALPCLVSLFSPALIMVSCTDHPVLCKN